MKKLITLGLLFIAVHTKAQETIWLQKANWLIGSWEGDYQRKPFYEAWLKKNDSVLVNIEIEPKGRDTVVNVLGELKKVDDTLYYGGKQQGL